MSDHVDLKLSALGSESGPIVVLLHGVGQTRYSWRGTMTGLAEQGYRVIAYDARGHGDSGWSASGDYSLAAMADDLHRMIGATSAVALIGSSMGGLTSLHALGHGLLPQAHCFVMIDIALRQPPEGSERIETFMRAHLDGFASPDEAAEAINAYDPLRLRKMTGERVARSLKARDGRFYWHWDPRILKARDERDAMIAALADVAPQVRIPAMLIAGAESDMIDREGIDEVRALLPQLEVVMLADSGHMIVGDRMDNFVATLSGFLRKHYPAG
ncbi:alpha/beta hydrolase [Sphingomonas sp. YL-JM2C]